MNTRSSALRRLLAAAALSAGLLLAGCDYSHPYGEPSGEPVDPALPGTWVETAGREDRPPRVLEIEAASATEFVVRFSGDTFHARRARETPDRFLQLEWIVPKHEKPASRTYVFCLYRFDGDELVVNRISEPEEESQRPATSEAVRTWVGRALHGESYRATVYRFRRQ